MSAVLAGAVASPAGLRRVLEDHWIEEPVRHDDYATSAELAVVLRTPVQIGENFAGPRAMALGLHHRASDLVMPDLERIGGVSGWLGAAAGARGPRIAVNCIR